VPVTETVTTLVTMPVTASVTPTDTMSLTAIRQQHRALLAPANP
jgi:hypothetical protein